MGELRSLKQNQVHISELEENPGRKIKPGEQIVDDATSEDATSKYKLVMVGRKVTD